LDVNDTSSGARGRMGRRDLTDMGGIRESFLTTHWSLIDQVSKDDHKDKNRALIEELIKQYWKPVYCYVRRRGYGNEEAKDLVQGFFHEVVLGRELIQKADKGVGRFRTFLLFSLNRYLMAVHRVEGAKKRIPASKKVPLDLVEPPELAAITSELTPEESFDYAWVSALLERVLEDVEASCYGDGKMVHWRIFRDRVMAPIMNETSAPSMEDICHKYGISDAVKASNMIVTVKRRFQSVLMRHLRNSVTSDEEADEELEEIMRFLPKMAQDGGQL
jgi:DNA-directed RNA polymerase specialized sigma24 family protein